MKIFTLLVLICANIIASDAGTLSKKPSKQIGFSVKAPYGIAISYRKSLYDKYGIEGSGVLLSHYRKFSGQTTGHETFWNFNVSATGDYTLLDSKFFRAFQYIEAGYFFAGHVLDERVTIDSVSYPYQQNENITNDFIIGDGLGLEFRLWKLGLALSSGLYWGYSFQRYDFINLKIAFKAEVFYMF